MARKPMRKTKTHFQQVPLEVVEKLLQREDIQPERRKDNLRGVVIVEGRASKTEPYSARKPL